MRFDNVFFFGISYLEATRQNLIAYFRWNDRIDYILAEREKGKLDPEVKAIHVPDNHAAMFELLDIQENREIWPNTSIADYFGLNSIKSNNDEHPSIWNEKPKRIRQMIFSPWRGRYRK